MMPATDVIIIGGGQAGLAMSACLSARGIDHLVLERGAVAERWRRASWDSLRLLTPDQLNTLPGGPPPADPDAFIPAADLVTRLAAYAERNAVPLLTGCEVRAVARDAIGFRIASTQGDFRARAVVAATGHCQEPALPDAAAGLPQSMCQLVPANYRRPAQLPDGPVLVVGASASGVQIADELHRSGRPVTLAVGRHATLPRRWRGRDIMVWLDALGILDERADAMRDLSALRRQPSLQLRGRATGPSVDLGALQRRGVQLAGRLADVVGGEFRFADDLAETTQAARLRMLRVLARIDAQDALAQVPQILGRATCSGFLFERELSRKPDSAFRDHAVVSRTCEENAAGDMSALPPEVIATGAPRSLPIAAFSAVVWATGHRRRYPWLQLPVLDAQGEIMHRGGITLVPGLYALGLHFMRRRRSSFIGGVGADAAELADHLADHLRAPRLAA